MPNKKKKGRCFVVMGFGEKTDYITGRKLDLNKSYHLLIKPVVEKKGYTCLRADEIKHAGMIDEVMYRELYGADIVIADLSAANLNAFYELGVRHALRPFTTIVISENKLPYPFNLSHISIEPYEHLGSDIGYSEVQRFRKVLGEKIDTVIKNQQNDSPIYTFLTDLVQPSLRTQTTEKAIKHIAAAVAQSNAETGGQNTMPKVVKDTGEKVQAKSTLSKLLQMGEKAIAAKQFTKAKEYFRKAFNLSISDSAAKTPGSAKQVSYDPYIVHRLALATYKAEKPNVIAAQEAALEWLEKLDLAHTNDPETVALAGAIEKKLYEKKQGDHHLNTGILYLERGFYLLNNLYNAINLAYMLNCRAASDIDKTTEEKIADLVTAQRIRQRMLQKCDEEFKVIMQREKDLLTENEHADEELMTSFLAASNTQKFWIWANKAEALFGLGKYEQFIKARQKALSFPHDKWMVQSLDSQVKKLEKLLDKQGFLMNPAWVKPTGHFALVNLKLT